MKRMGMALIAVMVLTTTVWAEPTKPAVEVRVKAIGELAPILEYGGELFGQADAGKQFAGILKQFTGDEKGYEGIDLNRPIGAYVYVAKELEDTTFVVMVPVADADSVVAAIGDKLGLEVKKGDGGLYSLEAPGVPGTVYFRFADKYAYVTLRNEKAIDPKAVIAPKTFFAEKVTSLLTAAVNIDALPEDIKKLAYGQLEMQLKEEQNKLSQSATQKLMNEFLLDVGVDAAKTVLLDGERFSLTLDVDPKADDWKLNVGLTAKSGTTLAKTLAGFADRESAAAGVAMNDGAASKSLFNFQLPPETAKKFAAVVDAVAKQAVIDAKESDKPVAQLFADALVPTLKAGDFQFGFRIDTPATGKKPGGVFALKTVKGEKLGELATLMAVGMPASAGSFKSNIDTIGERKLHQLSLTNQQDVPFAADTVWFMTSGDLLAGAADPKTDSLKGLTTAKPAKTPMLLTEISATSAVLMGEKALPPEKLQAVVKEVFGDGKPNGRDTMRLIATGGKKFDLTLSVKGKAIAFFAALDKAKKE
jgi:hypothetical protein